MPLDIGDLEVQVREGNARELHGFASRRGSTRSIDLWLVITIDEI
jgi:hypothetical protein